MNTYSVMRKVLLIAYHFPPAATIGAQRPAKLAKYLPRYGWEPVVLTVAACGQRPEGLRVVETPFRDVLRPARLLAGWIGNRGGAAGTAGGGSDAGGRSCLAQTVRDIVAYPDDCRGWYGFALRAGTDLLSRERIDAIVSTSFPVTAHLVARGLKQRFGLPWIADLRDLWTQNHYLAKSRLLAYGERRLELRTLGDADLIVTVSEPWAEALRSLHRRRPVACITNGFDEEEFEGEPVARTRAFTITHTGILYRGRRDPSLLFEVIGDLIRSGEIDRGMTRIRFFGCTEPWLAGLVDHYGLGDVVALSERIPREESLRCQQESQLLLLLRWDHPAEEGTHTAKVFEYLGSRRPVIAIGGPGGVISDLLETTGSGRFAAGREELKKIILAYYREYLMTGDIPWRGNEQVKDYTHASIAGRYAAALEGVAKSSRKTTGGAA